MTEEELSAEDQYFLFTAKQELAKAVKAQTDSRRALGQQHLREALMFRTKLPRGFTDKEFDEQYDRTYSLLYRGY